MARAGSGRRTAPFQLPDQPCHSPESTPYKEDSQRRTSAKPRNEPVSADWRESPKGSHISARHFQKCMCVLWIPCVSCLRAAKHGITQRALYGLAQRVKDWRGSCSLCKPSVPGSWAAKYFCISLKKSCGAEYISTVLFWTRKKPLKTQQAW